MESTETTRLERGVDFWIWTIHLPHWRLLLPEVKLLDITYKSGHRAFSPHGHDLGQFKRGEMSEDEYTQRYLEKMHDSRREHRQAWDGLSVGNYKALACYCKAGEYCHRRLFQHVAKTHLESMGWRVELMDEWTVGSRTDPKVLEAIAVRHKPA